MIQKKKSSNLHEWKEKMNLMKLIDENTLKENINNLVQYLNMIKKNRLKKLFNMLRKKCRYISTNIKLML